MVFVPFTSLLVRMVLGREHAYFFCETSFSREKLATHEPVNSPTNPFSLHHEILKEYHADLINSGRYFM